MRHSNQYIKQESIARMNRRILGIFLFFVLAAIVMGATRPSYKANALLSPWSPQDFRDNQAIATSSGRLNFLFKMRTAQAAELPKTPSITKDPTERDDNIVLIQKIWGNDAGIGLEIARCESGYRTHARGYNTNGTVDQGIFQINSVHTMPEMEIATANISYAYTMYLKQGTNPWLSSKHCWAN